MNERCFYNLILVYSIISVIVTFLYLLLYMPHIATDLLNLNSSIQNIPLENRIIVLDKLLDGQGQGTMSWAVIFLATITVFFTILLDLRKNESNDLKKTNKIDIILSVVAGLFLLASILSIFVILYYYRITDKLQQIY